MGSVLCEEDEHARGSAPASVRSASVDHEAVLEEDLFKDDHGASMPIWVIVVLVIAVFAVSSAGATFALVQDVAALRLGAWRLQMTSMLISPAFAWQFYRLEPALRRKTLRNVHKMAFSGLCLALHFSCWIWGLKHTSLIHAYLFVSVTPLVIAVGTLVLRKPISTGELAGTGLGVFGAIVLTFGHSQKAGEATLQGDIVTLGGAIFIIGYLQVGADLRRWMPLMVMAFPVTGIAGLCMAAASLVLEGSVVAPLDRGSILGWMAGVHLLPLLWLAIVPGIVGHQGLNLALKYISPLALSLTTATEPLIGSIIGYILGLTKPPGLYIYAGGALIIAATVIVTVASHVRKAAGAGSIKRQLSYSTLAHQEPLPEAATLELLPIIDGVLAVEHRLHTFDPRHPVPEVV